jgi:recombination protein RecT
MAQASSKALTAVATGNTSALATTKQERPKTIAGLLSDDNIKRQMALALPRHMTADRLARIALTEVRKNPKLGDADQGSFLGAIMQCAQLGLEPGGALGHCYLLPFDNRRKGVTEVQFIVGYKGMLDLARRSGQIVSIEARVVHEADEFRVTLGLHSDMVHVPAWDKADRGPLRFVYAVAHLKDGGTQFEVMSRAEIEKIRNESQGYKTAIKYGKTDSPWIGAFEEMAKKTVIRRLFKYLPVSIELATAVSLDERVDMNLAQEFPAAIDMGLVDQEPSETGGQLPAPDVINLDGWIGRIDNALDKDSAIDITAQALAALPAETDAINQAYEAAWGGA